jgi:outer membrane protein, heavy metal efflux system
MTFRKLVCVLFLPALAAAQPLASLVDEALLNNREILAAQKKYEAARQRPAQASALPDPTVSLGFSSTAYPWPGAGLGRDVTANIGLSVTQEMPFPGKRTLRGEIAGKEADASFDDYLSVRLSVVSRLKQAYHELHHATVGILFVKRYQDLLRNIISVSEARYTVSHTAQQDVFKAQTQFSIFETQLLRYEQERTSKEIEINTLLNRPGAGHIDVPLEMALGALPVTLDDLLAHARTQAPLLSGARKMVQRGELAANLARKDSRPDYALSAGYFNQGGMAPMWQMRVDVKLPAWFSKQNAEVAEQVFALSEARHNYEAADVAVQARIREFYSQAGTAQKLAGLYEKSVIPEARLALESSLSSYQTGALDFLAVFSNFMNVAEYELMYHEEVMQFHVSVAKLEELTGMEIKL